MKCHLKTSYKENKEQEFTCIMDHTSKAISGVTKHILYICNAVLGPDCNHTRLKAHPVHK